MDMMDSMNLGEPRPRVNASMLASHQGKAVCLLGKANNADGAGMGFQLLTSDNQQVAVTVEEPLQEYLDGLVEVHGVVDSQNRVKADDYINLNEFTATFDMESYDKAVQMTHRFPDHYMTGVPPQ